MTKKRKPTPRNGADAQLPLAPWFGAVSVVLIQRKIDGNLNVMNELSMVRANSRDEAIAYAGLQSQKRFPNHHIHSIAATQALHPNTTVTDAEPSTPASTRAQGPRSV